MNDYSKLAGAFMQQRQPRQQMQPRPMQPQNGGIVPPHMQQRPNLGFGPAPRPLGGGIMGGQPQQPRPFDGGMGRPMQSPMQSPQTGPGFGPSNPPRPLGGGIMGGQPQAPRPMQQPMNPPMGRRPY